MPVPYAALGLGLQAAGLAGSIFGRKKLPSTNTAAVRNLIQQGSEEEQRQIARLRPETQAQLDQFRTDTQGAQAKATAAQEASRTRLLQDLDPITSRLLRSQTDQLKRSTFGSIPETQQAVREALAASGGLNRGVAAEELARVPIEAARQFGEGAASLQQESLKTTEDALQDLQEQESQLIAKNLGIDQQTYDTILRTGNDALIKELDALIDESRNRIGGLLSAETAGQLGRQAQVAGENAQRQAIFEALGNVGGTLAGFNRPVGIEEAPVARRRVIRSSFGGNTATV